MKETNENSIKEAWVLCLILGMAMINFPFIHIFNTDRLIFGIPQLILYFFIGWPLSIVVIWVFVRSMEASSSEKTSKSGDNDNL